MRILITGIHGFVGSNLVEDLCGTHELYGLCSSMEAVPGVKKIFPWSALDDGSLPTVDAIIHLAGIAHTSGHNVTEAEYFEVNTGLTEKVYEYFRSSGASKFIFFSSVKAAADTLLGVLTEDMIPTPGDSYGKSKLKAENYILSHTPSPGKNVYILRPTLIHGRGMKGNMQQLFDLVKHFRHWPLGAYDNLRSFLSMDNLLFIMHNLLESNIESGTYNICDDSLVSTNRLIKIICEVLGRKAHIHRISPGMISMLARIGDALPLPLNSTRLKKLTESYIVSNSKIKAAIGIDSLPVDAVEGLYDDIYAMSGRKKPTPPPHKTLISN